MRSLFFAIDMNNIQHDQHLHIGHVGILPVPLLSQGVMWRRHPMIPTRPYIIHDTTFVVDFAKGKSFRELYIAPNGGDYHRYFIYPEDIFVYDPIARAVNSARYENDHKWPYYNGNKFIQTHPYLAW